MKLKRDFVELALHEGTNIRELCRRFRITAPTAYKWLGRYRQEGLEGPSGKGWERFEREAPTELWQMDFKGWFPTHDAGPCHPL